MRIEGISGPRTSGIPLLLDTPFRHVPDIEGDSWSDGEPITSTDLAEAKALTNLDYETVASRIPTKGNSVFHRHPEAPDIFEILALVCLDGRLMDGGKMEWSDVANGLNRDFPGLDCKGSQVKDFCLRYVAPHVVLPKSYMMRSVIEKGQSLDMLGRLMANSEAAEKGVQEALATLQRFEAGADGRLTRTGASVSELAAILKAKAAMDEKILSELERYGVVPEAKKKKEGNDVNVNVNLMGAMNQGRGKVIDAEDV